MVVWKQRGHGGSPGKPEIWFWSQITDNEESLFARLAKLKALSPSSDTKYWFIRELIRMEHICIIERGFGDES